MQTVVPTAKPLHSNPDGFLILYGFIISILIGFFGVILPALNSIRMKPSDIMRNIV
jgi:ABC-type antimicrobial peptide transport system permease subunit